jgi:hypothetical protein
MNKLTGARAAVGSLITRGSNVPLNAIKTGLVSVNPASINANSDGATPVTLAGVKAGDLVLMIPPAALEAGLVVKQPSRVTNADEVTVYLRNITGGAIDAAAADWDYVWFDLTD